MTLPSEFYINLCDSLIADRKDFDNVLETDPVVSIRINNTKTPSDKISFPEVPWNQHGFYLDQRPIFTLDPLFHAGSYYVQEASSMFVEYALNQTVNFQKPLLVLDLCAAPGGKSTQVNSLLNDRGLLLCNEVIKSRLPALKQNLSRWGHTNYLISNHEVEDFENLQALFDIVLVDAPCSGEGLFRKDKDAIKEWSLENVKLCAARQRRILKGAVDLVKPGGVLVYSTCTYNKVENEDNVRWLAQNFDLDAVPLMIEKEWNIEEQVYENGVGYQFFPHKLQGEGFYLSLFRKTSGASTISFKKSKFEKQSISKKEILILAEWIESCEEYFFTKNSRQEIFAFPRSLELQYNLLRRNLRRISQGILVGKIKNNNLVPSHELALNQMVNKNIPKIELDESQALLFLRKEDLKIAPYPPGWHLVTYQGFNLGWIKVLKNRINNYFPTSWRIKMDLPKT